MKKGIILFTLLGLLISFNSSTFAQEKEEQEFNQWFIDAGIGLTKPFRNFNSGYFSATPSLLSGELGARYMLNEQFGLKANFGYNHFKDAEYSKSFSTDLLRFEIQGVANIGRILKFESWTKTIGLLGHAGAGIGQFSYETTDTKDYIYHGMAGATAQVKVAPKVSINLTGDAILPLSQDMSFNGGSKNGKGLVFNGTVGISYSIGKKDNNADWYCREDQALACVHEKLAELAKSIENVENAKLDKDGNLASVDKLDKRVSNLEDDFNNAPKGNNSAQVMKDLINDGLTNIYFDYNSSKVADASLPSILIIKEYSANNPSAKLVLQGFTDSSGSAEYNLELAKKRAESVATILEDAGVDSSKISIDPQGIYTDVKNVTKETATISRRVSVKVQ